MMNNLTTRAVLGQITSASRRAGLDVPKALTDALVRVDQESNDAAHNLDVARGQVAGSLRAALDAGRDPLTDKALTRALLAAVLPERGEADILTRWADDRRAALLAEHLPALVASWRGVVDEAQAAVAAAREAAPSVDLTDPLAIAAVPVLHATTIGLAREGCERADRIADLWRMAAIATGVAHVGPGEPVALILADLSAAEVDKLGGRPNAAKIAHAGHALELATPDEFHARVARVAAERNKADSDRQTEAERYARSGKPVLARLVRR